MSRVKVHGNFATNQPSKEKGDTTGTKRQWQPNYSSDIYTTPIHNGPSCGSSNGSCDGSNSINSEEKIVQSINND